MVDVTGLSGLTSELAGVADPAAAADLLAADGRPGRQGSLPKVVATDLDGTLVRSDGTVSGYAREVLERVRAAGIAVVGVTGRGPRLIDGCRRDVPAADHLVLAQGGYVVDVARWPDTTVLHSVRVDGALVADAVDRIEAEVGRVHLMVEALTEPGAPLWGDPANGWPYPDPWEPTPRADALRGPVLKAFVHAPGCDVDALLAVARRVVPPDSCAVTHAGLRYVELCPPEVNKASGLAVVAAELGVDPGDVVVFGDMPNDVPMFVWAGHGVAVAGAHPELRAVADAQTLAADSDGLASYLDAMLDRGHL